MHVKHSFITLFALLLSLLLSGCSPDPQKDIALFQPFIDANIDKVSDDPYISSTLKPGDKFYDILKNLQHGRHDKAESRLIELMDQGDIQAQYWYARLIYGSSIKETPIALRLLKSTAEKNDPYALFALAGPGGGDGCLAYFGKRNCTPENFKKAIAIFEERAQTGDLRAQYFLLRMFKPDGSRIEHRAYFMYDFDYDNYYLDHSDETRAFFIKEIIRFAEGHYYQPLMDYVRYKMNYDKDAESVFDSPQTRQMVLQLLKIAANHNYTPAIELYIALEREHIQPDNPLFTKGINLGSVGVIKKRLNIFTNLPRLAHLDRIPKEENYFYNMLFKEMTGDTLYLSNSDIEAMNPVLKQKIDMQIKLTIKQMTPVVYIDEFTGRNNWVD